MEKKKSIILTARVPLRLAKSSDLSYEANGKKEKRIGLIYFLKNNDGKLECYELTEKTDTKELNQYFQQKRCFIIATIRFADYEAMLEEKEFVWIDNSVKQK